MCGTDWWRVGGAAASAAESPPHCSPGRTLEWNACRTEQINARYPSNTHSSWQRLKMENKQESTHTWRGHKTAGNVFRPPDSSSPCWRGCRTLWLDRPATPGVSGQPGSQSAPPAAHRMGSELNKGKNYFEKGNNSFNKSFPMFILWFCTSRN